MSSGTPSKNPLEHTLATTTPWSPPLSTAFRAELDERLATTDRADTVAQMARVRWAYAASVAAALLVAAVLPMALRSNGGHVDSGSVAHDPPSHGVAAPTPTRPDARRLLAAVPAPLQTEAGRLLADVRQFADRLPGTIVLGRRPEAGLSAGDPSDS